MAQVSAYPLQGLLGGVSIGISVSLFLLANESTFGVSGFLHRSLRKNGSWEDRLVVLGLLISGIFVGIIAESRQTVSAVSLLEQGTVFRAAISGLLTGVGSRLQNGCTSGHMICGISRFSTRSLLATSIFVIVASITSHIHHAYLPLVTGYDWSLGSIGLSLLAMEGLFILGLSVLLVLYYILGSRSQARYGISAAQKVTALTLAVIFGLGLHLSTLTSAVTVAAFLISPLPDPTVFNPTLLFLALSALPISSVLYRLVSHYQKSRATAKDVKNSEQCGSTRPLLDQRPTDEPVNQCGQASIAGDGTTDKSGPIDYALVAGAVLFGLGWGLEGICPGPSLVNMGRYIHAVAARQETTGISRLCVWLVAFVTGGKLVP